MRHEVLLINPSYQPHWSKCEPTGLLYIASFLKRMGLQVKILDMNVEIKTIKEIIDYIEGSNPGFVGISSITRQALRAYHLGRVIKKRFPDINLIYGGVHPTLMPNECFEMGSADYAVIGEGEQTMFELIKKIINHQSVEEIDGIFFRLGDKIVKTKERDFTDELDPLPFPDYSMLPLEKYNTNIHIKEFPGRTIHMLTSRGCNENCYYCCSPILYRRKVRFRSSENVVEEIRQAIDKYAVKNIHFHDDNFLSNPERVLDICNLIKKEKLSFNWICLARADIISQCPNVLPVMKRAGCVGIEFGVEAGDEFVLNKLNKRQSLDQIYLANKYLKQNNIYPIYLMMSYSLGENIDSAYKSAKIYYELKSDKKVKEIPALKDTFEPDLAGHLARPSPGSVFYKIASKRGCYMAKNWQNHIEEELNFIPNEFINDVAVKNKNLTYHEFLLFFKDYRDNLQLYINQNFYNSNPIMEKYFSGGIDKLLKFMFRVYKAINGKKTVRDIIDSLPGVKKDNLVKTATAVSMLSIFQIVKSKATR